MLNIQIKEDVMLRTPTREDALVLYKAVMENVEYLNKWLPDVVKTWDSISAVENSIRKWEKGRDEGSQLIFLIFKGAEFIGRVGLHAMNMDTGIKSRMITYWLVENAQGKGIMTDCVKCIVDYAFKILQLNRVYVLCNEKNKKSRAIPERLGFVQEGIIQDGECLHNRYDNIVFYGLLQRNWHQIN